MYSTAVNLYDTPATLRPTTNDDLPYLYAEVKKPQRRTPSVYAELSISSKNGPVYENTRSTNQLSKSASGDTSTTEYAVVKEIKTKVCISHYNYHR